jgi:carboxylesterase
LDTPQFVNPHLEGGPFYWEAGPVGVFLSHGFTATSAEVRPLAKNLHAAGYTVAGPLLPGHATHPKDLNRVHWQDWVRGGEEVYLQLKARCERVFTGGESMGAVLALYLASQHPETAGVLAYAPALMLNLHTLNILYLRLVAPFISWLPKAASDNNPYWQGYSVNPLKGAEQLLKFSHTVRHRLPLIRQPVMVVQGRIDTTVHPEVGKVILGGVSSSVKELHWMEKSGHVVIIDKEMDEVAQLTLEFLSRN